MAQSPDFVSAILEAFEARLLDLHVSTPGVVTAYDATTQKVSVQPLLMRAWLDDSGERQVSPVAIIADVPVMFPGSGSDGMTFPVKVGDTVKLLFSENAIGQWLRRGGGVLDPGDDRKHSLSDAVAICGLRDFAHPIPNVPTDAVVIRCSNEIRLGSASASEHTIKGDTFHTHFTTLMTALTTFSTAIGALNPVTASTAATTLNSAVTSFQGAWSTYLATKVKVE